MKGKTISVSSILRILFFSGCINLFLIIALNILAVILLPLFHAPPFSARQLFIASLWAMAVGVQTTSLVILVFSKQ
jgi:hypothetical protein